MRVLLISNRGDGLGAAWNIMNDGHDVHLTMRYPGEGSVGKGLYQRHGSWRPLLGKVDFIICDHIGMGIYEDVVRGRCKALFGGSFLGDVLNKRKRREFLNRCGLTTCSNFEHTVRIHSLFNGRNWIEPSILGLNEDYLFPGKLGPRVDSMGGVYIGVRNSSRIFQETLNKVSEGVKKLGLAGIISMDVLCGPEEIGVSNIYYGISHDIIEVLVEGLRESLIDVLFGTAAGVKESMDMTDDAVVSVRVSVPPWPYNAADERGPSLIEGINEDNRRHIHMLDVYKDGEFWLVGRSSNVPLKVTARGRDIREARRRVYRTLGNISIQDMQYRLDIGADTDQIVRELKEWGFI